MPGETDAFIQRTDGSDRSPLLLLGTGNPVVPYPTADRTLLLAFHGGLDTDWCIVADPSTGRAGSLAPREGASISFYYDDGTLIRYASSAGTPSRSIYYLDGVR